MKKVFAILLSFLLVISNISLTYATHFCGGKAIDSQLMLGVQDLSCGMIMPESTCENVESDCESPIQSEMDTNCCDNEYVNLSVDEDFNTTSAIELTTFVFVVAFVKTFFNPIVALGNTSKELYEEAAPLVKHDVRALFQVYLI